MLFLSPRCTDGRDRDKNCYSLKIKVPFVTDRFRPNLQWWRCIRMECQVWYFSNHAAIQGEIGAKICFGLKSKVLFVTDRFGPNLPWLWRMRSECHVWYFRDLAAMGGEIRTRHSFVLKSKVPFITDRFRPIVVVYTQGVLRVGLCHRALIRTRRDMGEKVFRPHE
jgi:hypothetical protein